MNKTELLADNIIKGYKLKPSEALGLLKADFHELLYASNKIRRHFKGDRVKLCAILNAKSGYCGEDCKYCAQSSKHKTEIERYPLLSQEHMLRALKDARAKGVSCFSIVTSGKKLSEKELNSVCGYLKKAGKSACALSVSIGEAGPEYLKALKKNGLNRFHHNIETAPSNFANICTTHSFSDKLKSIKHARALGLEVCSGGILGLGESSEQRVELAFALRDIGAQSVPVNFLSPIKGTPLEKMKTITPLEALRAIAVFRFVLPDRDITVCGGREAVLGDMQSWVFYAGASGLMVGNYLTTSGRDTGKDIKMIKDAGLKIAGK
ncbi:MAG TPA: biotin synthase BioB [Elusimicrobia bacterium]|nr:MAG: biotin synthase BioB [Elusimicrobia bacterium RIFOXYA12_FULL_49_49]OGS06865.1 MAG: biotin synthase BioB [Elusimicrobia bacterium RIFOXYA1_FULL_47_7]OGS10281.1 MAG: biotin synthase BioB [Elusimicrobia bacterium RIFOXYB1_FULL_48_9]OGS15004.1 MAG: biotin synthase BioB [Elusimicrobia bacterium RIFOXYA2_FULL_47_53]OGS26061.1 MAG: biotin synthase BioB [Elusimicrobia bacterium RIFOXYB12_FULL_50_12]OGS29348.1 MAG: biotin synthase BioB [Elusimicrobia bacterium RIFOXYB2_FULL_46_23]HBU70293.1 bi